MSNEPSTKRIWANAEKYAEEKVKAINDEHFNVYWAYIAGATAEASNTEQAVEAALHKERNAIMSKMIGMEVGYVKQIKLLSDALEKISNPMPELYDNAPYMRLVAKETLQQWKEGKEAEPVKEKWAQAQATWNSYPNGTKAKALMGGYWIKTERGWHWPGGGTFPTPGGDATGEVCLPD